MTVDRHPNWTSVVRLHWPRTIGFLLASREPCLTIRRQELAAVRGRALASKDVQDLFGWNPPPSWILAVLLCPGDSVERIVEWVRPRRVQADRVWFYLHAATPRQVLAPWAAAGLPTDQVAVVASWRELHKLFGLALNDRVYADWKDVP